MSESNLHRLSRDVLPVNYNLTLIPNFTDWTFNGYETIDLKVTKEAKEIVLNATALVVDTAIVNEENCEVKYDKECERITIPLSKSIMPGTAKLHLKFTGTLNDDMKGFYRSTYKTDNNEEIRMAVTQFEASDARRAFPCWDEPNIKATFDVTLVVPKTKTALSNMPEKSRSEVSDSLVKVEYERSPIMSTYLLAFVIGELDYVESHDSNGVKVRVYTAKDKSSRGNFALDVCCRTLPFYAEYFNIAYPLPKMDLVAIPDFAAGAMENWGLVTYRETMLLVDEHESSAISKQTVALVVGHECAHMWFGNLVTMDWWTDLWLNEGFATWIEYLCVDYCYPEFEIWTSFASNDYARALNLDALESSHPIQVTVHKPSEIDEIFDAISYAKGACVIRMLNDYLGNEVFKRGLSDYLATHKYQNAVTADLWASLSKVSGSQVSHMMDTWTNQTGFPVMSIEQCQDEHGNTNAITLRQRRFFAGGSVSPPIPEQFWIVPVTVVPMAEPHNILLKLVMEQHGGPQTFQLPVPQPGFVRINPSAVAYYHVQYQEAVLPALMAALVDNKLGPRDRHSIVLDLFALARSGAIPTTNALDVARSFKMETNLTVWRALLEEVQHISLLIDEFDSSLTPNVNRFVCQLIQSVYAKLGWETRPNESHNDTMLRPLIIRMLGQCGYEEVIDESSRRFNRHHDPLGDNENVGQALSADIRSAVYSTALKFGDDSYLNMMVDLLKGTDLLEERVHNMGSLGSVPHALLPRINTFAFSDEIDESSRSFNRHHDRSGDNQNVGQALSADIRSAVYSMALKFGNDSYLNKMLDLLKGTDLLEERVRNMGSLGWVPHALLPRIYKFAFSDEIDESSRSFNRHHDRSGDNQNVGQALSADIRSAVYSMALKFGNDSYLNMMLDLLKRTDLPEERVRIMNSLGLVPHALLPRIHTFAFSDDVRKQDKYRVLLSTVTGARSRALFWEFMKTEWAQFRTQVNNNYMFGFIIKTAFSDFVTEERHAELHQFFEQNPCEIRRAIEQTLENIQINVLHLRRDGNSLRHYFSQY